MVLFLSSRNGKMEPIPFDLTQNMIILNGILKLKWLKKRRNEKVENTSK